MRGFRFAVDYGIDPAVLAELVALEQAQLEVQDEIDEGPALAPEALAALSPEQWEDARFTFVRALRIVRATHDVLSGGRSGRARRSAGAAEGGEQRLARVSQRRRAAHAADRRARGGPLRATCSPGLRFAEVCDEDDALACVRALVEACQRGLLLRVA